VLVRVHRFGIESLQQGLFFPRASVNRQARRVALTPCVSPYHFVYLYGAAVYAYGVVVYAYGVAVYLYEAVVYAYGAAVYLYEAVVYAYGAAVYLYEAVV
jgi:hypothetical protein